MTALVLVLAGVAAGDGGVRAGAATAPLTEPPRLGLSRDWEWTVHVGGVAYPARLGRGEMTLSLRRPVTRPLALTLSSGGLALGNWGAYRFHGTYKVEGGRLLVCFRQVADSRPTACTPADGHLLTLKPAARRP